MQAVMFARTGRDENENLVRKTRASDKEKEVGPTQRRYETEMTRVPSAKTEHSMISSGAAYAKDGTDAVRTKGLRVYADISSRNSG